MRSWVQCPLRKKIAKSAVAVLRAWGEGSVTPVWPFRHHRGNGGSAWVAAAAVPGSRGGNDHASVLGRTPGASRCPQPARENYVNATNASWVGIGAPSSPVAVAAAAEQSLFAGAGGRPRSNCCL